MKRNFSEMTLLNDTPIFVQETTYTTPHKFSGISDTSRPKGYSESELKSVYLSREKLNDLRKRKFIV